MDDGECPEFSKNWYADMENLVKNDINQVFSDIKQYNASSYKKIVELEDKLKSVTSAKVALEAEVADLSGTMARQQKEAAEKEEVLRTDIRKLEEDNHTLVNSKSCKECGKKIETVHFCTNECIENNIK